MKQGIDRNQCNQINVESVLKKMTQTSWDPNQQLKHRLYSYKRIEIPLYHHLKRLESSFGQDYKAVQAFCCKKGILITIHFIFLQLKVFEAFLHLSSYFNTENNRN